MEPLTRRQFLKAGGAAAAVLALGRNGLALRLLAPVGIENPLERYPPRDWEQVYRDQYRYDGSFTFVCAPNDTHNCRMRAFVRNGVVARIEQNYDSDRITDALGNRATAHWNPRGCLKGMTLHRRVYGPFRLRHPMVRRGWKEWADDGYPYLTPELRERYRFTSRGTDTFVRVSWEEAFRYVAGGLLATAQHYSGEEGRRRLLGEGYAPEMVEAMGGAGTRTMKFRGGMGLLGVLGKYGMYRFSNLMALLDHHVRGVPPEQALGGRNWSNYTWHGDQAPGFPFVHGLQASDVDFNELRPAAHPGREEPRGEQDARVPLLPRGDGAGREDRHDRPRVLPAGHEVRLLDPGPPPDRRRPVPRDRPDPDRRGVVRRGLRQALHRPPAPGADRHGHGAWAGRRPT